jgi:hypothetical protein
MKQSDTTNLRTHCINIIVDDYLNTESKDTQLVAVLINGFSALKNMSEKDLVAEAWDRCRYTKAEAEALETTDEAIRTFLAATPAQDWCSRYLYS